MFGHLPKLHTQIVKNSLLLRIYIANMRRFDLASDLYSGGMNYILQLAS